MSQRNEIQDLIYNAPDGLTRSQIRERLPHINPKSISGALASREDYERIAVDRSGPLVLFKPINNLGRFWLSRPWIKHRCPENHTPRFC